ncbi:carboxyl transferase domain-containing protein [Nonomuraea sp. NEAU-A123]|uniref:carboxyl transferase domain-containing protein n=1 Tax=Nonomuraea sp. NEAU-A123 TaxID=2839649 RepID=UPI001BE46445|nr:carboxyl transferase domain-containing protein [Nonomuraea sp. NEAU-A123]MBT2230468.1 acetyl-CoA carboxylase carboxyltransferase subunit alpha/beta [Nonomuraea sp. NEAU-A123]
MARPTARELLAALLDDGTYQSWDAEPLDVRPDPAYAADLAAAREKTGLDESVITGRGLLRGRPVAVVAGEFGFLGGSIGVAAAERLASAVERATTERLPLLAAPASGGTRMQEGTVAFLQMIKIATAVAAHKAAALPYVVYLRHPTTGGVLASWGSLGHLTLAEPGALIGFLGPRVYEALHGTPFPQGVQTAENLHAHGLIDLVTAPTSLAATLDRALAALTSPRDSHNDSRSGSHGDCHSGSHGGGEDRPHRATGSASDASAWESVLATRMPNRPGSHHLLHNTATDVLQLGRPHGEIILALARFGPTPCVFLGQERTERPIGPAAIRLARRGIRLAADLRLPLVTVIDTPGAELSRAAEEGGLAHEIAQCLTELVTLPSPTVSLLLGQGAGGAALAILPADRVLATQHGWLSPLPLEGASAIVHRTPDRAPDLADAQRIQATDLIEAGLVDAVIAEHGDTTTFCHRAAQAIQEGLAQLGAMDPATRMHERWHRYRTIGLHQRR